MWLAYGNSKNEELQGRFKKIKELLVQILLM